MKQQSIVDSGESFKNGLGAMSNAHVKDFYEQMVKAGLYKAGRSRSLEDGDLVQFVNKHVGMDVKTKEAK